MKKFIVRVAVFAGLAVIVTTGVAAGVYFIQSTASFKLPAGKRVLAVGDSHVECAVDDGIFSSAVNVAQSANSYLYSYLVIRRFLQENAHLDTVLLSFHDAVSRAGIDKRWIFDERSMIYKIPLHFSLMDRDDLAVFSRDKVQLVKAVLSLPYRIMPGFATRRGHFSYRDLNIGSYQKLDRDKLQEHIARGGEEGGRDTTISLYQKEYLLKIVELCRSRGVELILVNTPVYKPEVYGNLDRLTDYYNRYLPGVKYMDYSGFPLDDSCRGDIEHLNYKGARVFSRYLREHLAGDVRAKYDVVSRPDVP